ncbi:hypothetical protein GC088_09980 [Arthrobacter sp. JZ12]|uniref:hypothetical protein n=1 Tax=Arthrobacter sp. JZ12 TaxID=2654190 RepID=UPI002B466FFA|nr:hypothetical protein [Arthrobacter sp. JZ12]WRH25357.1 hypothetical protein GC088_09980 [Arthrobacter sp. JZ12]
MKFIAKAAAALTLAGGLVLSAGVPANAVVRYYTMTNAFNTYTGCVSQFNYTKTRINASPTMQVVRSTPCAKDKWGTNAYRYYITYAYNM